MTDCTVVLVTAGSRAEGEQIAEAVITEGLAACVNIVGPIQSIYRWQGQVQRDEEFLLVIKTHMTRVGDLEARVKALHSYDTPEVIAVPISAGSHAYLDWVRSLTRMPTD